MTRPSSLAVIIVSWNVKSLLDACLLSLREEVSRSKVNTSVWVIDNASVDGSPTMVQQQHPWINLDASPENLGYVRANNRILQLLKQTGMPDYVWLLNPDTVIHAGSISMLLDFMETHPQAGLITPQLLNPDGTLQPGAFRFPGLLQPFFDFGIAPQRLYYTRLNGRYAKTLYAKGAPFHIDHPLGAAMLARGTTIQQVGLLDEAFFMYCEEIDWAWRMKKAGWTSWMVPQAKIIHYGGASTKQAKPQSTAYLWESRARLYRKHRGWLTRTLVGHLVRHTFSHRPASSPEWQQAYQDIIEAWK